MSDEITLRFSYERALWRRAMTGWWRSVVPPEPFIKRAIFWAVIWLCIGLVTLAIAATGQTPYLMAAGLIGAGILIVVFAYLQRTRMSRFWDIVGAHWDRAGEMEAGFDADGVTLQDSVSKRNLQWSAIDAIKGVRGATVLRSGISMIVIPDRALPEGMKADAFRTRLNEWWRP